MTGAARETMRRIVDRLESVENLPEAIQQKLLELALELRTVSGKKKYGYLKKPLKDKVDSIVDELEKLPEVAIRWRATTKANRDNTIHSRSRKNSVPSRTPSFRKRSVCGSRWSRKLRKLKNRLRKKLLETLLQIQRLQPKILRPQPLILCGFHPSIC